MTETYFVELATRYNGRDQLIQCLDEEVNAEYMKDYKIKTISEPYQITKLQALWMLANEVIDPAQAMIVCKGFATDDDDFVEVNRDDLDALYSDDAYDEFEIWSTTEHTTHN